MIGRALFLGCFLVAGLGLAACGTGGGPTPPPGSQTPKTPTIDGSGLALLTTAVVPGLTVGGSFSYDIGAVDTTAGNYYLSDRTNKALDVMNLQSYVVQQAKVGYAGASPAGNPYSGPDGDTPLPNTGLVYTGDVNSVKIVNSANLSLVKDIVTGNAGLRTDEGCYDPDDGLMMFVNGENSPPYANFISTSSQSVVSVFTFSGPQFGAGEVGLDACVYDHNTKNFYVNNDGTTTNPYGELDVIPAASVVAGAPVVSAQYDEGSGAQGGATNDCNPSGINLNPNNDALVIACDTNAGNPQLTLIMSATTGAVLASITGVGGSDEAAYDPKLNRFYVAARDMTANGISQTGSATATFTPVLGIIDASSFAWIANVPTGKGSHSVAVDPANGYVYVPVPPTTSSAGGIDVFYPH
ncbi:MAG TPA: hypothetical protein VMD91_11000 [Candidatus Sulfotelmatobacter sp.]|nr:hypothetical protein [Candidatus Sulfotelmatobacter sp.]